MEPVSTAAAAALDRFFEHYYRRRPVNATFTGVHDFDDRLPDWSLSGLEALRDEVRALRREIDGHRRPAHPIALPMAPTLNWPLEVDLELASSFLEIQEAELDSLRFQHGNPSLFAGEAVFGVIGLVTRAFAPIEARLAAAASRMRAIPGFLGDVRTTIGRRPVAASWLTRALNEAQGAQLFFLSGLEKLLASLPAGHDPVARAAHAAAAETASAFAAFSDWLRRDAQSEGARVGCGPDFFDLVLERAHWSRRRRDDLLAEVRERLAEGREQLDRAARSLDTAGWVGVQARLDRDHPDADHYLDAFEQIWAQCRKRAIEADLVTWPDYPIRYAPIPPHTRDAAPLLYYLFYRSPAPLDPVTVHDYVVPPIDDTPTGDERERRLRAANRSTIMLNHVVHHGGLGHHVQNYYASRSASRIGQVAAVDCACRIGMLLGGTMAEGGACYATDLAEEAGLLDELAKVANQHSRVRQLARAVADIELHQGTMDEEQAVAFYIDRAGMSEQAARGEVTRNAMFPGQAVMYWLGTDAIHRLRDERTRLEGRAFSLGRFHDRFLSFGSLPVALIAQLMTTGDARAS